MPPKKKKQVVDYFDSEEYLADQAMVGGEEAVPEQKVNSQESSPPSEAQEVRIKSKKEKEKERKERQKQREKQEREAAKSVNVSDEQPKEETKDTTEASQETATTGKPKKKIAALKAMMEAQRLQAEKEEQERKLQEERERERIRLIEEQERAEMEERERKKREKKERIEKMKREGTYVSAEERKKREMAQKKLEAMIESGMVVGGGGTGKKVVYERKKKKNVEKDVAANEAKKEEKKEPEPVKTLEEPAEEVAESWEEEIADSWEDSLESLEENKEQKEEPLESDESDEEPGTDEQPKAQEPEPSTDKQVSAPSTPPNEPVDMSNLRSPICVILGHVDTGKTKLLDKIRQTNVQEGEAGGITQQIGATYFPASSLVQKTLTLTQSTNYSKVDERKTGFSPNVQFNVPGLLMIDTPGHESFTNLRSRGSSLCNIAVLVVDLMHGLEPQTVESINLLKMRKTPFIVALNKIDRIYGWKSQQDGACLDSFKLQSKAVLKEFKDRLDHVKLQFSEQGLNAELFDRNPDVRKYVSLVPTSALTGEGIPDLLALLIQLTQSRMTKQLILSSTLEATVLEVKVIEGLGTTIDVILSNGILNEGDRIVLSGLNGPITTQIRALLTPQPMREIRVKSQYVNHKQIKAAMGVKISAPDLDKAIAGSRVLRVDREEDLEKLEKEAMKDISDLFDSVDKEGVVVQASTLGSLEALLTFLRDMKIPVSGINIGSVFKKDVIKASIQPEEYRVILAFDVKIDAEIEDMAVKEDVKIFKADILYHLFDRFTEYKNKVKEEKMKRLAADAVFPCVMKILPGCVFNKKDPIIVGVEITEGSLKVGTPIAARGQLLGKCVGIEKEHKPVQQAKKGSQVAVRIDGESTYGRHFDEKDQLISKISRKSIDVLKEGFRDEVSKEEWLLIKKLKVILNID